MKFADYADEVRSSHKPRLAARRPPSPWGAKLLSEGCEDELEKLPEWAPAYLAAFDTYLRSGALGDRLAMHAIFARAHPEIAAAPATQRTRRLDADRELCDDQARDDVRDTPSLRLASR